MDIAMRLNEAMREAGFGDNQSALARASDVPQSTINRILKGGGRRGPESATIHKLAAACGVNFQWLMEGVGPKRRGEPAKTEEGQEYRPAPQLAPPPSRLALLEIAPQELMELISLYGHATKGGRISILSAARATVAAGASLLSDTSAGNQTERR